MVLGVPSPARAREEEEEEEERTLEVRSNYQRAWRHLDMKIAPPLPSRDKPPPSQSLFYR